MVEHRVSQAWWFHSGTSYPPTQETPTAAVAAAVGGPVLALPPPQGPDTSLKAAIAGRASCRSFSGEPLTPAELSTLLDIAYGVQGHATVTGFDFEFRSVPSAGACYPLEIHLIVLSVADLPSGTYRYQPSRRSLERTGPPVSPDAACDLFLGQRYLAAASAIAVVTATLRTSLARYGDRGYRYVLLEGGHVAQNLNLASSALRLGSLNIGGFLDRSLAETLRLAEHVALYAVALGRPSSAEGQEMRQP